MPDAGLRVARPSSCGVALSISSLNFTHHRHSMRNPKLHCRRDKDARQGRCSLVYARYIRVYVCVYACAGACMRAFPCPRISLPVFSSSSSLVCTRSLSHSPFLPLCLTTSLYHVRKRRGWVGAGGGGRAGVRAVGWGDEKVGGVRGRARARMHAYAAESGPKCPFHEHTTVLRTSGWVGL